MRAVKRSAPGRAWHICKNLCAYDCLYQQWCSK